MNPRFVKAVADGKDDDAVGKDVVSDEGDVGENVAVMVLVVVVLGGKSGLGRRWMGLGRAVRV